MYKVIQHGKEIGAGTLTECIEHIATSMSQFHPEQVTARQAVEAGYPISRD